MALIVSAILPTRGRREWARQAVDFFLAQDYPAKELVILDDWSEPSFPSGVHHPLVRYYSDGRLDIPRKRNRACQAAVGDVVAHWDSDDYSAPSRLSIQVANLEAFGADVTGFRVMKLYDDRTGLWYQHSADNSCFGASLLYRRWWWEAHPFDEANRTAEDYAFYTHAAKQGRAACIIDAGATMAARIHGGNTATKNVTSFRRIPEPLSEPLRKWAFGAVLAL